MDNNLDLDFNTFFDEPEAPAEPAEGVEVPAEDGVAKDTIDEQEAAEFFEDLDEGTPEDTAESEEEASEEEEEQPKDDTPNVDAVSKLKELGVIPEDSDVTEDLLPDYLDDRLQVEVEEQVVSLLDSWKQTLSDDGAQFIEFSRAGGSMEDYIKTYTETPLHLFDVSNETGQESFLRYYLTKIDNKTPEEADDQIEYFVERDVLEANAKKAFARAKQVRDAQIKELHDTQIQSKKKFEQEREKAKEALKNSIAEVEETAGYKFGSTEKNLLTRFILKPTVKRGDTYVSEFSNKLQDVYSSSPDKLLLIAKLLKTDFDLSFLERATETKVARKAKETVNQKNRVGKKPTVVWEY